ncbi:MAG: lysylphosphatidylglycerol synthase transmembrane domain-containing protein [Planctomycetota bacterium]|nr:lysylphosphatidylglycerol synthase transmembrane domain-containing protein [Planctomycetota bacterium]
MVWLKMALFLGAFLILTGLGVWWSLTGADIAPGLWGEFFDLPIPTLLALVTLCVSIYLAEIWRYRSYAAAFGIELSALGAFEAAVANFLFAWITPGAALGAPASVYMLSRRGISWESGALISFGKSMTGAAFLLLAAFILMLCGYGPELTPALQFLFLWSGFGILSFFAGPIIGALWPESTMRFVRRAEANLLALSWIQRGPGAGLVQRAVLSFEEAVLRLSLLRKIGWRLWPHLLGAQLAYFLSFAGIAMILLEARGAAAPLESGALSIIFLAFTYVAPTPGGAGLSEAAAGTFFGALLSPANCLWVVVFFRSLTLYGQIVFGMLYLLIVGGIREIVTRPNKDGPSKKDDRNAKEISRS